MDIDEAVRKMFLAGVGAISMTGEKAKELVDELVRRGEISVSQGKVLTEDLQRKIREKMKNVPNWKPSVEHVAECVERMTKEERETLRKKLNDLEEKESKFAEDISAFFHDAK